jgi:hypothetical protein
MKPEFVHACATSSAESTCKHWEKKGLKACRVSQHGILLMLKVVRNLKTLPASSGSENKR